MGKRSRNPSFSGGAPRGGGQVGSGSRRSRTASEGDQLSAPVPAGYMGRHSTSSMGGGRGRGRTQSGSQQQGAVGGGGGRGKAKRTKSSSESEKEPTKVPSSTASKK